MSRRRGAWAALSEEELARAAADTGSGEAQALRRPASGAERHPRPVRRAPRVLQQLGLGRRRGGGGRRPARWAWTSRSNAPRRHGARSPQRMFAPDERSALDALDGDARRRSVPPLLGRQGGVCKGAGARACDALRRVLGRARAALAGGHRRRGRRLDGVRLDERRQAPGRGGGGRRLGGRVALAENLSAEALVRQNIEAIKRGYHSVGAGELRRHARHHRSGRRGPRPPRIARSRAPTTGTRAPGRRWRRATRPSRGSSCSRRSSSREGDYVIVVLTMRGTGAAAASRSRSGSRISGRCATGRRSRSRSTAIRTTPFVTRARTPEPALT